RKLAMLSCLQTTELLEPIGTGISSLRARAPSDYRPLDVATHGPGTGRVRSADGASHVQLSEPAARRLAEVNNLLTHVIAQIYKLLIAGVNPDQTSGGIFVV